MALAARHSQRAALQAQAVGHREAAASRRWGRWRGAPADTGAKIPFDLPIRKSRLIYLSAPGTAVAQANAVVVIGRRHAQPTPAADHQPRQQRGPITNHAEPGLG